MNWMQKYDKLVLRDYPFFYLSIRENERHGKKSYEGGHMFGFPRPEFHCLSDAKAYMETVLYKEFKQWQDNLDIIKTFKDLEAVKHIYVSHTEWCNNNGDGKYHNKNAPELWKQYQWIEGRFSITSATSKRYALRYDIDITEARVKQHAIILVKRHINRFIREYES